jgi:hypothetical protein
VIRAKDAQRDVIADFAARIIEMLTTMVLDGHLWVIDQDRARVRGGTKRHQD